MIKKNSILRYISRLNTIIVKEITLGYKYRWHATTKQTDTYLPGITFQFHAVSYPHTKQ